MTPRGSPRERDGGENEGRGGRAKEGKGTGDGTTRNETRVFIAAVVKAVRPASVHRRFDTYRVFVFRGSSRLLSDVRDRRDAAAISANTIARRKLLYTADGRREGDRGTRYQCMSVRKKMRRAETFLVSARPSPSSDSLVAPPSRRHNARSPFLLLLVKPGKSRAR
ncbi:hypothetical protein PUN28_019076 [Cardiocondyla obscurior]|uniref:Uncharacterized protein n=1 Tax=Cardiocondyla obscurior TaxID=286306 RepID=A0AAW2ED90_9HYME